MPRARRAGKGLAKDGIIMRKKSERFGEIGKSPFRLEKGEGKHGGIQQGPVLSSDAYFTMGKGAYAPVKPGMGYANGYAPTGFNSPGDVLKQGELGMMAGQTINSGMGMKKLNLEQHHHSAIEGGNIIHEGAKKASYVINGVNNPLHGLKKLIGAGGLQEERMFFHPPVYQMSMTPPHNSSGLINTG